MGEVKTCPDCRRTYSDPFISFCLSDGNILSAPSSTPMMTERLQFPSEITEIARRRERHRVHVRNERIRFGNHVSISLERTLRIPEDGQKYPLPASLGSFPVYNVADFRDTVPSHWNKQGGVFIPMYQREALFIDFTNHQSWKPRIIKVGTGKVNAISGKQWHQAIVHNEQDYVVVPPQEWIDGFNVGFETVRQFVAMPFGSGYSVEGQLTGAESVGGIQIAVYEPRDGVFKEPEWQHEVLRSVASPPLDAEEMALAPGGRIRQKIYKDKYGAGTWDPFHCSRIFIHIANSEVFQKITGIQPPKSPITAKDYERFKIPWFDVYDESLADVKAGEELYQVKSVNLVDKISGLDQLEDENEITVDEDKIKFLGQENVEIEDGDW